MDASRPSWIFSKIKNVGHHPQDIPNIHIKFHDPGTCSLRDLSSDGMTDGRTDGRNDGRTDGRTRPIPKFHFRMKWNNNLETEYCSVF